MRGEHLGNAQRLKSKIEDSDIPQEVKRNKNRKKNRADDYKAELDEIKTQIALVDLRIQEILEIYGDGLMDSLEQLKEDRRYIEQSMKKDLADYDDANARMLTALRDAEERMLNAEEQAELFARLIAEGERELEKKAAEVEANPQA